MQKNTKNRKIQKYKIKKAEKCKKIIYNVRWNYSRRMFHVGKFAAMCGDRVKETRTGISFPFSLGQSK